MAYTVQELIRELRDFLGEYADRNVVVGGRWGIAGVTGPGSSLGKAVELELEDVGIDDAGRASLLELFRYLGERPEYRNLQFAQRADVISLLLPADREEALALAMAAIARRDGADGQPP